MTTIQARRRLIVVLLLCVALAGGIVRHFAERGTTLRDVSSLLMMLWLPVIGSVVGWFYKKMVEARQRRREAAEPAAPPTFDGRTEFKPQLLVEFTLRPTTVPAEDGPLPAGEHRCALVVDNQGFSARWGVAVGQIVRRGERHQTEVEFLAPDVALPRFTADTPFRMLVGKAFVADGKVVRAL